jgi:hypothetical protein
MAGRSCSATRRLRRVIDRWRHRLRCAELSRCSNACDPHRAARGHHCRGTDPPAPPPLCQSFLEHLIDSA